MTVKVLGICASKGGVGKSTLATALGAMAANHGERVAILDGDPQGSVAMWWELRGEPENPDVLEMRDVVKDVATLRGEDWDWVIIDTPPGQLSNRIEPIVRVSDFMLVPVRVSVWDQDAVMPVVLACDKYRKDFAFVLTQLGPQGEHHAAQLEKVLKTKGGTVLKQRIGFRAAYATALTVGKTGPEAADKRQAKVAHEEIETVWDELRRLMSVKALQVA